MPDRADDLVLFDDDGIDEEPRCDTCDRPDWACACVRCRCARCLPAGAPKRTVVDVPTKGGAL